ncbi:MAG: (2Fe-2S)-binding protein, partial [Firmicutes bacterium]|nr:(2Fe-2S)-binding protein [Bacillota bacterium]
MIVTIDGRVCECEKGEFLLQVAKRNGIDIPTLCHHDGLPGQAACRVCLVEVKDGARSQVTASCVFPVDHEVEVFT